MICFRQVGFFGRGHAFSVTPADAPDNLTMVFAVTTIAVPQDQWAAFINAGLCTVERVRAEPGCTSCALFHDVGTDGRFVIIEEWSSMNTLERHIQGQSYREMLALMEMSSRPCDVSFHTVRDTKDMELVHRALAKIDKPW